MRLRRGAAVGLAAAGLSVATALAGTEVTPKTQRIGVARDGSQLGRGSELPRLSGNGRYVAFAARTAKVVAGDKNGSLDVFVRDRIAKTNELVSVATDGTQGDAASFPNAITPDGRFVVFTSAASTFATPDVAPGLEEALDVFVRDRLMGTTERISVNSDGEPGNAPSFDADISDDGRFVVFESGAGNLDPADDNGTYDIFVRDRHQGSTEIVSVKTNGRARNLMSTAPSISGDGSVVAFDSDATNLVRNDTNQWADSFIHLMSSGRTRRVSLTSSGDQSERGAVDPEISGDGNSVLMFSQSPLVPGDTNTKGEAYVYDMSSEDVELVSTGCTKHCFPSSISRDGRYVVFASTSPRIVPHDTNDESDYFLYDRVGADVMRVNVNSKGKQAKGDRGFVVGADISADGRFVAFESSAYNLVSNDTNKAYDTFLRGPLPTGAG